MSPLRILIADDHAVVRAGLRALLESRAGDADRVLLAAVDALRRHKTYFSTRVSTVTDAGDSAEQSAEVPRRSRLTPREREVLQLLAEGKSNKEVSSLLGISVNTAEAHRANIMLKLDLHSITELVHYAVRNKIIKT